MNIWGHKKQAEVALRNERYWEKRLTERGIYAKIKFNFWQSIKKWHYEKIKEKKDKK